MNGHEVLSKVEKGYRMPKPTGGSLPCPDPYYDIMLQCWKRNADSRPTFEYLRDFFDNYFVSSEGQYSGEPMGWQFEQKQNDRIFMKIPSATHSRSVGYIKAFQSFLRSGGLFYIQSKYFFIFVRNSNHGEKEF